MDESGTDVAEWEESSGAIRSLLYAMGRHLECVRVLHELLFMSVLLYCSETTIWREKERSRTSAVQMDSLRGLLDIRRMDRMPNARIGELWE